MIDRGKLPGTSRIDWSELADLLIRAQAGDQVAYRLFLQALLPYLRKLAGRKLGRVEDAEDAVQETLRSIHAIRNTYDPRRLLEPWVYAIAQRRIADKLRSIYRINSREAPLPERFSETIADDRANSESGDDLAWEPASRGGVALEADALGRAIRSLSPRQREAVELLKLREMSLREAASVSGRTEASLKVAMHRALKSLQRLFGVD